MILRENNKLPLILAHRGLVTEYQENTEDAVLGAADSMYCDGAEVDVFLTKDKKVVLCHDENLKRLTGANKNIWDVTWNELKNAKIKQDLEVDGGIRYYDKKRPFILLHDILNMIKGDKEFLLNIELKANFPNWGRRDTGTEVAKIIRMTQTESQVFCTSFDFFMLHALEKEYGVIHTGYAYDDNMPLPARLLQWLMEKNIIGRTICSTVVDIEHTLIDGDTIEKFHDKELTVGSFTLFPLLREGRTGKLQDAVHSSIVKRLVGMDVDWIETDRPKHVYDVLHGEQ